MKKYCVEIERFSIGGKREYERYYFIFRLFAILKAKGVSRKLNNVFHNQDRVFIKKNGFYYNPDKKYSNMLGISWTTLKH